MEIREITDSDVSAMARMVLSLMNGMGMKEPIANRVIKSIIEVHGLTPPILW